MAASLRAAATRILRPAGHGLRRLGHTQEHSGSTRALEEGYPTVQIQQKKEELYDLIADAYANSETSQADRYVLKVLSTQIKPRPRDPQWCEITTIKKAGEWFLGGFYFVGGIIILSGLAQGVRKRAELEMPKPVEPRRIKKKLQKQVE
ncbi:hypothetical protein VPH35_094554 [Triticum aestivum]|uniref:uncharacterized protein n=1 Tax=Triticum aestivum TaxID=4565 RepID=UPI00162D8E32|nr:uncharacterized protein LOC123117845 [Triticum aestivum]